MPSKPITTDLFSTDVEEPLNIETEASNESEEVNQEATIINDNGLTVKRRFTKKGKNPLDTVEYERRSSRITEPNGEVVFELTNLEVPKSWSQLATDILASKYCRRAGVPETGYETSAKQVVHRIANTIRQFGQEQKYFSSKEDAASFESELSHILIKVMGKD